MWGFQRAGKGTRTLDPDLGKVVLYQLSYSREDDPIIDKKNRPVKGYVKRNVIFFENWWMLEYIGGEKSKNKEFLWTQRNTLTFIW